MNRDSIDDAAAERLLRGSAPAERPELEPLSVLLSQVRDLGEATPKPSPALYALLRDGFEPAAAATTAPATTPSRSSLRRRLAAVAGLSLGLKVLTGTGVALAGVTTAAGVGVLPDAVQERVSSVVRTITPFELDQEPALPTERTDERDTAPRGPDGNGPAYGEPTLPDQAPMDTPPRTVPPQQPPVPAPAPAPREDAPAPTSDRAPDERPAPAPQDRPGDAEAPRENAPAPQQGDSAADPQSQREAATDETPADAAPTDETPAGTAQRGQRPAGVASVRSGSAPAL